MHFVGGHKSSRIVKIYTFVYNIIHHSENA